MGLVEKFLHHQEKDIEELSEQVTLRLEQIATDREEPLTSDMRDQLKKAVEKGIRKIYAEGDWDRAKAVFLESMGMLRTNTESSDEVGTFRPWLGNMNELL